MAIHFSTRDPKKLLSVFKKKIQEKSIVTWSYDNDGDFTHTTPQWNHKAWLRPKEKDGELIFNILSPKNTRLSVELYAIFHGRFIESMLAHCDDLFSSVRTTALPENSDIIGG